MSRPTVLRKTEIARARRRERAIAKELGVTEAGLDWLAKLVANPMRATKRSNEAARLVRDGFVVELPFPDEYRGKGGVYYRSGNLQFANGAPIQPVWSITEAGRDIVRRARQMGW